MTEPFGEAVKCVTCAEDIPTKSPSEFYCSSVCQQSWMESNAEWPAWAYSWNGRNRKGEASTAAGPTYYHPSWGM